MIVDESLKHEFITVHSQKKKKKKEKHTQHLSSRPSEKGLRGVIAENRYWQCCANDIKYILAS